MINHNILGIILDKISLIKWQQKICILNKEYYQKWKFNNILIYAPPHSRYICDECGNFIYNYMNHRFSDKVYLSDFYINSIYSRRHVYCRKDNEKYEIKKLMPSF